MTGVTDERAEGVAPPGLRSEELATSDEGRRCLKGARDERETHGASRGRGAAWTEERGARDERRGKAVPQRRPETSGKHSERAAGLWASVGHQALAAEGGSGGRHRAGRRLRAGGAGRDAAQA